MVAVRLAATNERGALRIFVPFELEWLCERHGTTETAQGWACADSGAPTSMLPSMALPPCIAWDDLPDEGLGDRSLDGRRAYRWWNGATLTCLGTPVTSRVKVWEGNAPDFPIFGVDWFRAHRVALDLGADPPVFEFEPYRPTTRRTELRLMDVRDLPLVAYDGVTFRIPSDGRHTLALTPGEPAGVPRQLRAPERPSRAVVGAETIRPRRKRR